MNYLRTLLKATTYGSAADAGLLILRMGAGLLMATHGWSKLMGFSEKSGDFYNFMGLGDEISLALTVFAEFFCSMFLVLGIGTRLFLVPLIIVAVVIVFVVHGPDPLGDKEHGILFLVPYITLMLTGPGKYSIDYLVQPGKGK
ncbi:MAG TPA: DoxX family protein [Saprospiraceae bacterium]|jgi:putative oxidoreductase|nr:DoxX family protein [Saprospiraceae bacterium]HQW25332.1 DoxX family protein [Saprospiraceae bacterium]